MRRGRADAAKVDVGHTNRQVRTAAARQLRVGAGRRGRRRPVANVVHVARSAVVIRDVSASRRFHGTRDGGTRVCGTR